MSDLDRTITSVSNGQELNIRGASEQAVGKLRSLAKRGSVATADAHDPSNALAGDAFAEVFAMMATSKAESNLSPVENTTLNHAEPIEGPREDSSSQDDAGDRSGDPSSRDESEQESIELGLDVGLVPVQTQETAAANEEIDLSLDVGLAPEQAEGELQVESQEEATVIAQVTEGVPVEQAFASSEQELSSGRRATKNQADVNAPVPVETQWNQDAVTPELRKQTVATPSMSQDNATEGSLVDGLATSEGAGIFGGDSSEGGGKRDSRRQHFGIKDPGKDPGAAAQEENAASMAAKSEKVTGEAIDLALSSRSKSAPSAPPAAANPSAVRSVTNAVAATHNGTSATAGNRGGTSGSSQGVQSVNSASGLEGPGAERHRETDRSRSTDPKTNKKSVNNAEMLNRIKLIQRVSKAFQHVGAEGGVIRLRLAPAELGSIRLEMQVQQKKVSARVVAETEAAAASLRENIGDLRGRLEALGMQVESLEISQEQAGTNSGKHNPDLAQQFADHREQTKQDRSLADQNSQRGTREFHKEVDAETPIPSLAGPLEWTPNSGVDLHV